MLPSMFKRRLPTTRVPVSLVASSTRQETDCSELPASLDRWLQEATLSHLHPSLRLDHLFLVPMHLPLLHSSPRLLQPSPINMVPRRQAISHRSHRKRLSNRRKHMAGMVLQTLMPHHHHFRRPTHPHMHQAEDMVDRNLSRMATECRATTHMALRLHRRHLHHRLVLDSLPMEPRPRLRLSPLLNDEICLDGMTRPAWLGRPNVQRVRLVKRPNQLPSCRRSPCHKSNQ